MKKVKRSCMCFGLVLCMFLCSMTLSVSAREVEEVSRSGEVVTMSVPGTVQPKYNIPSGAGGYISGGYGEIPCFLGNYISSGYIQATVSPSTATGNVTCFVRLPNGTIKGLGTVPAAGGSTPMVPMYTMQTGTYTFIFQPTTTATLYVVGNIY